MKCFRCQAQLTKQDVCLKCGVNVRLYKKIIYSSDHLYNLGLEKANQRDLTGARNYLRQSLQLNKEHVQARNLLGLIYYELGYPAEASREWVLSENFQPEGNPATEYLRRIERKMGSISGSVKRYNQALAYLEQGSRDLAIIQMKQLMTRSYQMICARQLMALLYMQDGYFNRAKKILLKCAKVDEGDPTTKRYLKALDERKPVGKDSSIRQAVVEAVETPRETDVIIPQNNREYGSYFMYVLYIMIGLILGAGCIYYIVVPSVRQQEQENNRAALESYEMSLMDFQNQIVDYVAEVARLEEEISVLEDEIAKAEPLSESVYEDLLSVLTAYINNDVEAIMDEILALDPDIDDELYQDIYQRLRDDYEDNMGSRCFYRGTEYMDEGEYEDALVMFELACQINGVDARILYYLGLSHELTGDLTWAAYYYQYAIVNFPDDDWTENSTERLQSLLSQNRSLEVPEVSAGDDLDGLTTESPEALPEPSEDE